MVDVSPERISQNSGFQALVAVALELLAAETQVVKAMNPDQRSDYAARANALGTEARNAAASQREQATADLGELLGLTEAVTDALMLRAHTAAQEFGNTFPELAGMDERRKLDTLAEAVRRDPALPRAVEGMVQADISEQECLATCLALLIIFTSAAIAMLVVLIAACLTLILAVPLMILCIIGATAAMLAIVALALNIYNSCISHCKDVGND